MFDVEILVPSLETSRLLLRPLRRTDAPNIQKYFPHPEIVEFFDSDIPWPYPPDGALHYLDTVALPAMEAGLEYRWAITLKGSPDHLIGTITLYPFSPNDNRGFWLALPFHGQGLMKEAVIAVNDFAFYELGMKRLYSHGADKNQATRRLKEMSGATLIGIEENVSFMSGIGRRLHWVIERAAWDRQRQTLLQCPLTLPVFAWSAQLMAAQATGALDRVRASA
jgi:RimJ/RimL family protein N-acetyltransferase